MTRLVAGVSRIVSALALLALLAHPVQAASKSEEFVETARFSLERLLEEENFQLASFIKEGKGIYIIPELVKGGFIVGAEGGTGVFLVKGPDGTWSSPAFYTLAAGSIGLQIGGQVSEVAFVMMTDLAVEAMLADEFKLGADASVSVGPLGAGVEAATTTNFSRDIIAFSKSAGLFGGGALEGAKIFKRKELNQEFYGPEATPEGILIQRRFNNPLANNLKRTLADVD